MATQINTNQIKDDAVTAAKLAAGWIPITETIPAGAASVDWTSIAATYDALWVIAECTPANDGVHMYLTINGDSAANYGWGSAEGNNNSDNQIQLNANTCGSAANEHGTFQLWIANYAGTARAKITSCVYSHMRATGVSEAWAPSLAR